MAIFALSHVFIYIEYIKRGKFMFGCMPIYGNCGYNPRFSDTVSGIQAGLAGLNGITNIFEAKNNGASTADAISYGMANASAGIGNALLGNVIDKSTHSYLGTTLNTVMPTLTGNNPWAATPALASTALFSSAMHPFMHMNFMPMMPMATSFSYYSSWSSPMMFGGSMMMGGGMPPFGRFCCCC